MLLLTIIAFIVVANAIIGAVYKRNKRSKDLDKKFELEVYTLITYENFIFAIILSIIATYLLYDTSSKSLDIYSVIIIGLILILSAFKLITQKYYKPIICNDGILFYNGIMLPWGGINEIRVITQKKSEDIVVLIGGRVSNTVIAREKIVVKQSSLQMFENLISSKANIK